MTDDLERRRRAYRAALVAADGRSLHIGWGDEGMDAFEAIVAAWHAAGGRLPGDEPAPFAKETGIAAGVELWLDGAEASDAIALGIDTFAASFSGQDPAFEPPKAEPQNGLRVRVCVAVTPDNDWQAYGRVDTNDVYSMGQAARFIDRIEQFRWIEATIAPYQPANEPVSQGVEVVGD